MPQVSSQSNMLLKKEQAPSETKGDSHFNKHCSCSFQFYFHPISIFFTFVTEKMMASSSFPPLPMSLFLALVHQSPTSCDNKDKSLPTVGTGFHQSPPLPLFLSIETSKSCKIEIEFSFLVSLRFPF